MDNLQLKKNVGRPRKFIDTYSTTYENQTEYNKKYYEKNKEKMKEKYKQNKKMIHCECGKILSQTKLQDHLQTTLHKRKLSLQKNNNTVYFD